MESKDIYGGENLGRVSEKQFTAHYNVEGISK